MPCLAILPSKFDTPMFWDEAELEELKGTSVVGWSPRVWLHDDVLMTCRFLRR